MPSWLPIPNYIFWGDSSRLRKKWGKSNLFRGKISSRRRDWFFRRGRPPTAASGRGAHFTVGTQEKPEPGVLWWRGWAAGDPSQKSMMDWGIRRTYSTSFYPSLQFTPTSSDYLLLSPVCCCYYVVDLTLEGVSSGILRLGKVVTNRILIKHMLLLKIVITLVLPRHVQLAPWYAYPMPNSFPSNHCDAFVFQKHPAE